MDAVQRDTYSVSLTLDGFNDSLYTYELGSLVTNLNHYAHQLNDVHNPEIFTPLHRRIINNMTYNLSSLIRTGNLLNMVGPPDGNWTKIRDGIATDARRLYADPNYRANKYEEPYRVYADRVTHDRFGGTVDQEIFDSAVLHYKIETAADVVSGDRNTYPSGTNLVMDSPNNPEDFEQFYTLYKNNVYATMDSAVGENRSSEDVKEAWNVTIDLMKSSLLSSILLQDQERWDETFWNNEERAS